MMTCMKAMPDAELAGRRIAASLVAGANKTGEDQTETALLRRMLEEATKYISDHSWCVSVLDSYFGGGVGGVFSVFLFHIQPSRSEVDPWIWIMVGDIPPAYLPISDCDSPAEAFHTYLRGMRKWVEYAKKEQTGSEDEEVPPVNLPATPEWADHLGMKLDVLSELMGSFFES
jgi:hypothetical protein